MKPMTYLSRSFSLLPGITFLFLLQNVSGDNQAFAQPDSPTRTQGTAAPNPSPSPGREPGAKTKTSPENDLPLPESSEYKGCVALKSTAKIAYNLRPEVDLNDLVDFIRSITCKNFLITVPVPQNKVVIKVPGLISVDDAYRVFLSALESMGLTIQRVGKLHKIVSSQRAKETTSILGDEQGVPGTDMYYTKFVKLRYLSPEEVISTFKDLQGRDGKMVPASSARAVIITDTGFNIRRLEDLLEELDKPTANQDRLFIIRLKNAGAPEVVQMISSLFGIQAPGGSTPGYGGGGNPRRPYYPPQGGGYPGQSPSAEGAPASITQAVADARSNSIILVASERGYRQVRSLVDELERRGGAPSGQIHFYPLKNATAAGMANILQGLGVTASISESGFKSNSSTGGSSGMASSASSLGSFSRPPSFPSGLGGGMGGSGTTGTNINIGPFQGNVRVTADVSTNQLVILANKADYLLLKRIIDQLDQPRKQVFLQMGIFEVNLTKTKDLGLSYHGGLPVLGNNALVVGGLRGKNLNSANILNYLTLNGLVGGLVGPQLQGSSIFGSGATGSTLPPQYGLLLQAMQTDQDIKILSSPNVMATDNMQTTFESGQNLPFPAAITGGLPVSSGATGSSAFTALQSIERKDVSLKFNMTPHINTSDFISLETEIEISDVAQEDYYGRGPATTKHIIKSFPVVRDQSSVVLGGIMYDKTSDTVTKIPGLGEIPILGYLFKNRSKSDTKKMLMVVITPYIITSPDDLPRIFQDKYREYAQLVESSSFVNADPVPVLSTDYRYKPGILDEIERVSRESDETERNNKELERDQSPLPSGPIDLQPENTKASRKARLDD